VAGGGKPLKQRRASWSRIQVKGRNRIAPWPPPRRQAGGVRKELELEMPIAESLAPVLVAIGMFSAIVVIAMGSMVLRSRAQERLHRERMFLAEKGLPIPQELYAPRKSDNGDLRNARAWLLVLGVMMLFIGIAVMITIGVTDTGGIRASARGLAPVAIGLGLLVAERLLVKRLVQPRTKV
jgi:hypothetical protein